VLAAIGQPMARADHHRITKSFRQPMLKNVNAPAHDKNDNGGDHEPERRVLLCFPCVSRRLCIEVLGNNQNCLASSTACLFPASIMSTARPSVFDGESYDTADAYEPQPKFDVTAEIFEAWLRDSFEAGRVALSPDIRNESFIDAQ
jgi:hypothetical protein